MIFEHFIPYFFGLNFAFYTAGSQILSGRANSVDPDQTVPSGSALFAYVTLSDT